MFRINSIGSINKVQTFKPSFKGNEKQTNPQINQVQEVKPDFAVKTPIAYTKTGEIDFPYDTKAHCYKLANGQKVIVIPQEGETVLRTYVNTGSMNEPDNIRGISHYIEHNLFNGSDGYENGDFFNQVNKMGASTNASTGFAETNYYISSNLLNESDLENKIKLHSSMLQSPLFAVEKLEKEKGIVNSEINMITSDPQNIAVNKMLKNLYGVKSSSSDLIGGTTDNITNLTREDVVNYFNNNYYPANMVTVITGDVKPEETMKLISKYFTSKKQPNNTQYNEKLNPIQQTVREDVISNKASATSIVIGFDGSNDEKERIHSEALSLLLSNTETSRINQKIRDFNAFSGIGEEKFTTNQNRAIILSAECSDENSEKILKTMFNEIGNVANNPPTDEEMQIIKKRMLNSFSKIFEDSFDTNSLIGTSILENKENYIKNYEKIVKEMTAEDLVNISQKYLDLNKASVVVIHPASSNIDKIAQNHKDASNISFTGRQAINMDSVKQYNMPNNYRVVTLNSKTNNVNFGLEIRKNNNTLTNHPSASLILNEIFSEGSMFRDQQKFKTDLAKNGIESYIDASKKSIIANFECSSEDMQNALESIKEVIENPRFDEKVFEQAKSKIQDSILTSEKSPYEKLNAEIYKGLPYGTTKEEILKDLETVSLNDVKAQYELLINNSKGMAVISAPFDKNDSLKNTFFNQINSFKPVEKYSPTELIENYKPVEETKVLTDIHNKNQAEIVEAYKFKINDNLKDRTTIMLLDNILGGSSSSRLFMDLREKQKLAYHVNSDFDFIDDIGTFSLHIGTTTDNKETGEKSFDNVKKSIDGFNKHIQKLRNEKVTEEELNNAKLTLKNNILNANHSANDKVSNLLKNLKTPYGITKTNKMFEEIDKITIDDIYNASNNIFASKPTYSILATEDTLNANKEYFEELNKLQ